MFKFITKLVNRFKKKANLRYMRISAITKYRSENTKLMSEFTEVVRLIDRLTDQMQGGETPEGNRVVTTPPVITEDQLWEVKDALNYLLRYCLKDRKQTGVASVENALVYLGKIKKGQNPLHVLLIVKALVETGISVRGYVMQEINPEEWRSCDGRWMIKKILAGKKFVYDIYLIAGEEGIFTLRCSRKGDAEEVLRGSRRI